MEGRICQIGIRLGWESRIQFGTNIYLCEFIKRRRRAARSAARPKAEREALRRPKAEAEAKGRSRGRRPKTEAEGKQPKENANNQWMGWIGSIKGVLDTPAGGWY